MEATNEGKESKIARFLEVFGNIFTLNVLFAVSCIPVITIGPALAAMYSVALKMVRKEEGPIWKSYKTAFAENFKKSILAWLIVLAALFIIWGEYVYVCNFEGNIAAAYIVVIVVELVLMAFTLPFLFPLIARYDNTLANTFKNAFLLSVSNFGSWLKIFLTWFAPLFLSIWYPEIFLLTWYMWLLLIFGLIAYGTSFTMRKVFDKISEVQGAADKKEEKN